MAAKTLVKVLLVSVAVVLTGFTALVTVVLPQKPVADAGADRTVDVGEGFSFDGLGSTGTGLVYTWYTADGNPTLVGPSPSYSYPTQGVYQVSLVLRDSAGQYDLDTVDITVRMAPEGDEEAVLGSDPEVAPGSEPTLRELRWVDQDELRGIELLPAHIKTRLLEDAAAGWSPNGTYLGGSAD